MATTAGASHIVTESGTGIAAPAPIPEEQRPGAAGTSRAPDGTPSAQQFEDLNFYLRRLTVGTNGDMSQIENFGGGSDYEMFLEAVSSMGIRHGWSEAETLRTVEMKLKDKAREYYGALLPSERPRSMLEMKQFFRRVFGRKLTIAAGKRELERCIRTPGEPLGEYAQRLKVIVNKMFPAAALVAPERLYHRNMMLVNQFIDGLDRRLANEVLRAGEFYNLDECLEVAEDCEEVVSRMLPETRFDTVRSTEAQRYHGSATTEDYRGTSRGFLDTSRTSYEARHNGGNSRWQPRQRRPEEQGGMTRTSNGAARNSPRRPRNDGRRMPRAGLQERFPYMNNRCTRCGQEGHVSQGCRNRRILFCFHCGKVGEVCNLNWQRPGTQPAT